jgi:hypothetical protein
VRYIFVGTYLAAETWRHHAGIARRDVLQVNYDEDVYRCRGFKADEVVIIHGYRGGVFAFQHPRLAATLAQYVAMGAREEVVQ